MAAVPAHAEVPDPAVTDAPASDGRRQHYGVFYGIHPLEPDGRPVVVGWGNCQAEAMRVLVELGTAGSVCCVRIPPVHELTTDDLPHLRRLLARTDVVITQPVADDYRGMPLGTGQIVRLLPASARVVRWPALFFAGLYPYQALVRQPDVGDPPVVPYHDLRTVVEAATGRRPPPPSHATAQAYRRIAEDSLAALAARERAHDTLVVSDLLLHPTVGLCHTINHPGNPWLLAAAERVCAHLGWAFEAADPGRVLLSSVLTPLEEPVLAALGLTAPPRPTWILAGQEVGDDEVRQAQLGFYRQHPGFVTEGLRRHAPVIAQLGLA